MLADAEAAAPEVILIATGSEVSLCVEAYEKLTAEGVKWLTPWLDGVTRREHLAGIG